MELVIHPAARPAFERLAEAKTVSVLLHGPSGVGLTTLARELGRQLLCTGCTDHSCADCRRLAAGSHDRLFEILPDEKGKIGIDDIATLRHRLTLQHTSQTMQVVIIDQADTMTLAAQNALLKSLEEPPPGTLMILTAYTAEGLLPTIRSRMQAHYFPVPGEQAVATHLSSHYHLPSAQAAELAQLGRGLPALAIRMYQQPALREQQRTAREYLERLTSPQLYQRLRAAGDVAKDGGSLGMLLAMLPGWAQTELRRLNNPQIIMAVQHVQERLRANLSAKSALEAFAVELPC